MLDYKCGQYHFHLDLIVEFPLYPSTGQSYIKIIHNRFPKNNIVNENLFHISTNTIIVYSNVLKVKLTTLCFFKIFWFYWLQSRQNGWNWIFYHGQHIESRGEDRTISSPSTAMPAVKEKLGEIFQTSPGHFAFCMRSLWPGALFANAIHRAHREASATNSKHNKWETAREDLNIQQGHQWEWRYLCRNWI